MRTVMLNVLEVHFFFLWIFSVMLNNFMHHLAVTHPVKFNKHPSQMSLVFINWFSSLPFIKIKLLSTLEDVFKDL